MKDKPEQETQQPRKPYRKPELRKVMLKPDEAVLGYCKTDNKRGPGIGVCDSPVRCYVIGS